jgi:predicted small integral membrane protein
MVINSLGGMKTLSVDNGTRYLKIALIFFVALQGLVGGFGNLASIDTTYAGVARVLSMDGVPSSVIGASVQPANNLLEWTCRKRHAADV